MTDHAVMDTMLKVLPSEDAATQLMETFPLDASNWSEALSIMAHRSWKRPDQMRLARFFLKKMPFAAATPYEAFASFVSVPRLIAVIKEALPSKPEERQWLRITSVAF